MKWNRPTSFNKCMRMTCYSHTNPISELIFFLIQIQTPIPIGLIPIQIQGFTKIYYCDSHSDSSSKWFNSDSDSSFSQKNLDSDSDSGSSITWSRFQFQQTRLWFQFWFRNHLQLWLKAYLYCVLLSFWICWKQKLECNLSLILFFSQHKKPSLHHSNVTSR